jgi:hypothetical protein
VAFEELDFVALVEDPDLRRTELIGRVQQPHEPVADVATFVVLEWHDAGRFERKMRGLGSGAQRIGAPNLL